MATVALLAIELEVGFRDEGVVLPTNTIPFSKQTNLLLRTK